jgi:hypothetical protein
MFLIYVYIVMFRVPFSVCLRLILAYEYIGEGVRLCYEWRVCVCGGGGAFRAFRENV